MLRLIRHHIFENPLGSRLLTTAITGPKLGGAFLIVNICLLITYISLFSFFLEAGHLGGPDTPGKLLYFWQNVVLYGLLTFLLPPKVAGVIEGSRMGKALDQIVVTGSSPLKFYLGSWAIGLFYAILLLVPSIPYLGCATLFGGIEVLPLLQGYGILILYANVIIAVTLALSVFEREWVTVPLTILFFFLAGIFSIIMDSDWVWGYPIHVAEITPLRLFYRQATPYEIFGSRGMQMTPFVWGDPVFFDISIPLSLYPYLLWGGIISVALIVLTIGPNHRFVQGMNTFGTVTFAGDRRKRFLRLLRGGLSRRVELAFFYENRPAWCARWDYLLRAVISTIPVLFCWGLILGRTYMGYPAHNSGRFYNDEDMIVSFILNGLVLCLWMLAQCDPKYRVYWKERLGRFEITRELLLLAHFLVLLVILFLAQYWMLSAMQSNASDPEELVNYVIHWWTFVPGLLFLLFNLFLLSRISSRGTQSANFSRFSTVFLGLVLVVCPMVIAFLVLEEILPNGLMSLGALSPIILADEIRPIPWSLGERFARYLILQALVSIFLGGFLILCHFVKYRLQRMKLTSLQRGVATAFILGLLSISSPLLAQAPIPETPAEDAGKNGPPREIPALVIQQISRGFDGFIFSRHFDFYTITVQNTGNDTITGEFWIDYDMWASDARPFEIGPNSTKVVRLDASMSNRRGYWTTYQPSKIVFEAAGKRSISEMLFLEVYDRQQQGQVRRSNQPQQKISPFTYLLIGEKAGVSREWITAALHGDSKHLVECASRSLPENFLRYYGIHTVFIGPDDLSDWTARQRDALYNYVRLGGAVVFFGGFEQSGLAGADIWQDLLKTTASSTLTTSQAHFRVEQLLEGEVTHAIPNPDDDTSIPLLITRSIGPGSISHLSFNITKPVLPDQQEKSLQFWTSFNKALPKSAFPFLFTSYRSYDSRLWDISTMLMIGGYFLVYSLVYAFYLIIFFRKKHRRNRLWIAIPGVPVLFVFGLPVLDKIMHSKPSYAEYRELIFYGKNSSHALVTADLRVRSSGRQEHAVSLRGEQLQVYPQNLPMGYYIQASERLFYIGDSMSMTAGTDDRSGLDVITAPWAARQVFAVDTRELGGPLQGEISISRRSKATYRLRATRDLEGYDLYLLLFNIRGSKIRLLQIPRSPNPQGLLTGSIDINDMRSLNRVDAIQLNPKREHHFFWKPTQAPRAILALAPIHHDDQSNHLDISSPDLLFEKEISRDSFRRLTRYGQGYHLFQREGKYYRNHRYSLELQEITLEMD